MARSRNIKPSFFISEQISENCPLGRLLFIGMWTLADYKGDLEWREKTIKIQVLPWDDCDIKKLAINLDKSGLIRFYSDGNKLFVNIPNFEKHQNPHKNERAKGSDIPCYSNNGRQLIDLKGLAINRDKSRQEPECSQSDPADSLLLIPDSPCPDSHQDQDQGKIQYEKIKEIFNETIGQHIGKIKAISPARKTGIRARIGEDPEKRINLEWWRKYFDYASSCPLLVGMTPPREPGGKPWRASFDWLINPNNMVKVIEGKYDER